MFLTNLHKKDAFLAELLAYIIYLLYLRTPGMQNVATTEHFLLYF